MIALAEKRSIIRGAYWLERGREEGIFEGSVIRGLKTMYEPAALCFISIGGNNTYNPNAVIPDMSMSAIDTYTAYTSARWVRFL